MIIEYILYFYIIYKAKHFLLKKTYFFVEKLEKVITGRTLVHAHDRDFTNEFITKSTDESF